MITATEAAKLTGYKRESVGHAIRNGLLKGEKINGKYYVEEADAKAWAVDPAKHKKILPAKGYLTVSEAAERCYYSDFVIRKACRSGQLKSVRFGTHRYIREEDLRRWVDETDRW